MAKDSSTASTSWWQPAAAAPAAESDSAHDAVAGDVIETPAELLTRPKPTKPRRWMP